MNPATQLLTSAAALSLSCTLLLAQDPPQQPFRETSTAGRPTDTNYFYFQTIWTF